MPRSREILLPWDRQPQEAVEIDWSNPITQGLTVAITNSGGVPYDAVRGVPLTTTFGSVPTGETTNKGVTTKGAGGGWVYAAPGSAPTGVSDFCVVRISSADNYGGIFAHAAVGGATGNGGIQRDALTNELICFNRTSGGSGVATTGSAYSTVTNGNFHSLGLTVSGVTVSIYLDGLLNRSANDSVSQETLASERLVLFGERGASASFGSDGNYLVHLTWARILSADEYAWLHQNYWQLFAPQTIPVPVSAGGGTVTMAAQDAAHAHALDNAALSIGVTLTVADLAHGHALDASTLSTGTALAVADSLHAHALDNVTLSTAGAISLTVADLLHAHALDAVVLTSQTDLVVADLAHGHALDGVTLTLGGISLVIAEIMHAHALDVVALTLDTYLAVADILHAHTLDNVLVSIPGGTLDLILKILVNRQELNPATGTFTLYDNDGTTVLYTTSAWADAAGTVPYSGGALRRIDALF